MQCTSRVVGRATRGGLRAGSERIAVGDVRRHSRARYGQRLRRGRWLVTEHDVAAFAGAARLVDVGDFSAGERAVENVNLIDQALEIFVETALPAADPKIVPLRMRVAECTRPANRVDQHAVAVGSDLDVVVDQRDVRPLAYRRNKAGI